jgi:hypothetical protein
MSSSESELNVRPDVVRVVKEALNSEYVHNLTSKSEIIKLTVIKSFLNCSLKWSIVTLMFITIVILQNKLCCKLLKCHVHLLSKFSRTPIFRIMVVCN